MNPPYGIIRISISAKSAILVVMSTGITAQLHKLMIIGIMAILISPTIMINDNNTEITAKENEPILEEDTLSLTDGRVPDPNMMACPCPLYPSIANITNDDDSPIDHLFVREGTGSVNDMTYPIDISWPTIALKIILHPAPARGHILMETVTICGPSLVKHTTFTSATNSV